MRQRGHNAAPLNAETKTGLSRWMGPAVILTAAALATAPIVRHGSFCGDDFEFHVVSWFDVHQSWQHGIFYPHWMPSANYGAGEPRFIFYPPLTWMLGAALGFVLPWQIAPLAMVFLFLACTGLAVRKLAREALTDGPATLAGCAALLSGFSLFTAYERTAFAELTGGFWIPLLLMLALRDRNPTERLWRRALDGSALPLALVIAGCWLSDGPVGVMASYLLAAVAIAAAALWRSWAPLLRALLAAVLGMGLPALYLLPAAREQGWVDLHAAVNYPVFQIENNWLFARHTDPFLAPYGMVLHRASMLTASMIAVALLGATVLLFPRKPQVSKKVFSLAGGSNLERSRWCWWVVLAIIPAVVLFLEFKISLPVWNLLPKLRFLQYPWRWALVVEGPMAIFFAAAVWPARTASRPQRALVAAVCGAGLITVTLLGAQRFLRVCKEGDTVTDLLKKYRSGSGLEGTDEYEPPDADHWRIATGLPDACLVDNWNAALGVADRPNAIPEWTPEQGTCEATARARLRVTDHFKVTLNTPRACYLVLRLLSYPAWRLTVNGQATAPSDMRDDGLIGVAVPRGTVEVSADWTTTPDVVAGRCLSAAALLLMVGLGVLERKQLKRRP